MNSVFFCWWMLLAICWIKYFCGCLGSCLILFSLWMFGSTFSYSPKLYLFDACFSLLEFFQTCNVPNKVIHDMHLQASMSHPRWYQRLAIKYTNRNRIKYFYHHWDLYYLCHISYTEIFIHFCLLATHRFAEVCLKEIFILMI